MGFDHETIFIAYGSNLSFGPESASQAFASVVKTLQDKGVIVNIISRLWASKAWPNESDPPYVNAVMAARSPLEPLELLALLHEIEREGGRMRDGRRNAPRTVDLDLIAYGQRVMEGAELTLPHPRAHDRGFVMGPLAEIMPDWRHPVLKRTAENLFQDITVGQDAHPLDED